MRWKEVVWPVLSRSQGGRQWSWHSSKEKSWRRIRASQAHRMALPVLCMPQTLPGVREMEKWRPRVREGRRRGRGRGRGSRFRDAGAGQEEN